MNFRHGRHGRHYQISFFGRTGVCVCVFVGGGDVECAKRGKMSAREKGKDTR